jgi:hypothetical protein
MQGWSPDAGAPYNPYTGTCCGERKERSILFGKMKIKKTD